MTYRLLGILLFTFTGFFTACGGTSTGTPLKVDIDFSSSSLATFPAGLSFKMCLRSVVFYSTTGGQSVSIELSPTGTYYNLPTSGKMSIASDISGDLTEGTYNRLAFYFSDSCSALTQVTNSFGTFDVNMDGEVISFPFATSFNLTSGNNPLTINVTQVFSNLVDAMDADGVRVVLTADSGFVQ